MKFVQFFVTIGRRITIDYKLRDNGATLRHLTVDVAYGDLVAELYDFGETNFVSLQSDCRAIYDEAKNGISPPLVAAAVLSNFGSTRDNDFLNAKDWNAFCTGEYYHVNALRVLNELQTLMQVTNG